MDKKLIIRGVIAIVGLMALIFILELFGLGMFKFFGPKKENIRREIFENTKSFTHGKIQDLAKFYQEYQKADPDGTETLRAVIQSEFSDFDAEKIQNYKLRQFLIKMRGY